MLPEMGDDAGRVRSKREESRWVREGGKEETEEGTESTF